MSYKGYKASPETREKQRLAHLGKKRTPESIVKTRQGCLGKKRSPEAIEKTRQAALGRKCSQETRQKLRQANLGKTVSSETREKLRQIKKGTKPSRKCIEKATQAKIGKNLPAEHREKISKEKSTLSQGGKGINHWRSKSGILRSPNNKTYRFLNLTYFIRTNPHLFNEEDVLPRQYGSARAFSCRALGGLTGLFGKNPNGSWKGWTVVSDYECGANDGVDLLGRDELTPEATIAEISTEGRDEQ